MTPNHKTNICPQIWPQILYIASWCIGHCRLICRAAVSFIFLDIPHFSTRPREKANLHALAFPLARKRLEPGPPCADNAKNSLRTARSTYADWRLLTFTAFLWFGAIGGLGKMQRKCARQIACIFQPVCSERVFIFQPVCSERVFFVAAAKVYIGCNMC